MAEILASSDDATKRRNHVGSYFGGNKKPGEPISQMKPPQAH
jgi:hypothetical protein